MSDPRLDELTPDEFQGIMDNLLSDEFDQMTVTEFFGSLAAMDETEPEVIELTVHLENGELVLDQSALLPVTGSEILVDNKRIIIRLREPVQVS